MLDSLSRTLQANPSSPPFWERACRPLLALLVSILLALPISGVAQTTQTLSLESGWNTVSLYVQPDDSSFATLFDGTPVSMVKNEDGEVYLPSEGVEQISTWKVDEGYKVYAETATTLGISGVEASPGATKIVLDKGGNIVPYLSTGSQAVEQALVSIEESLVAVEDGDGVRYDPSASSSPLDSLRPGQGYEVYVDQPDTLIYPVRAETLADALSLEGVQSGQYIRTRGRDEAGDGGGGIFVVTDSACETDGATCFIPESELASVTESSTIDHTDLSWRHTKVVYGPDPEDEMEMYELHGWNGRKMYQDPWIDLKNGTERLDDGFSPFEKLTPNVGFGSQGDELFTYKYATSDLRVERKGVTNSVKPEWWGAPRMDPNNPQEADQWLRWAFAKAAEIYRQESYDWVYVDIEDAFYRNNWVPFQEKVWLRGTGDLNQDGYTRGEIRQLPGELVFHRKDDYDKWADPDRKRVHNILLGKVNEQFMAGDDPKGIGMSKILFDGNVRNNMHVFNNLGDYSMPDGSSITSWFQDGGGGNAFYDAGGDWPQNMPFEVQDVNILDVAASGLSTGNNSVVADFSVDNLHVRDARRNHLIYGLNGDNLSNITIEGQFWGSASPLGDPRGNDISPTYTNLTIKNVEEGQFNYNTIFASRSNAELTVDGFTIDLSNADKSFGAAPGILKADGFGTEWKNGTIRGYKPENWDESGINGTDPKPTLFVQRGTKDPPFNPDKNTLLKNITVYDHGVGINLTPSGGSTTRRFRVEDFTYKAAQGVTPDGGDIGKYTLKSHSAAKAWRVYYKNFVWEPGTEKTFEHGAANDGRLANGPLDWYMEGGSVNNEHGYNSIVNSAGGTPADAIARAVRLFLNGAEFRTQTEQNTSNTSKYWHGDLMPNNNVRLRNCTDKSGRVSENSGTYTSDAGDEGNDYLLIDPNLISHPHQRSATVTSGNPSVTSVEGAKPDGTAVDGSNSNNLVDAQKHVLRVNLDQSIGTGNTIDVDWSAQITPDEDYQTTGLFIARQVVSEDGSNGLDYTSGNGPFTYDLRGVASSQESGEKIVYTASSDDTSVVTSNVQSDDYTLELTEQSAGTATITVTGEIPGVGAATTTFEVTVE